MDQKLLKQAYECGVEFEQTYHGCAQCVIGAVYKVLPELRNDDVFRSACAQAGGMGLSSQGQCGALVAGGMILSQLYGRELDDLEDPKGTRKSAYQLGAEYLKRFVDKMGAIKCGDIQTKRMGRSFNLMDDDDREEFESLGGHESHCPDVVGSACQIIVEMILEKREAEA